MPKRSTLFSSRKHNRYWWYALSDSKYIPPVFQCLSDDEWELLNEWFYDTEQKYPSPGEIGVPGISFLSGLIGGNGLSRIVQCGHYVGFSSLMLGFLLRGMGKKQSLFSIDNDQAVTKYTQSWMDRADLNSYVKLTVNDSANHDNVATAEEWLGGKPQIVFIDSSHQYGHTLRELDLWYDQLTPGGILLMHDVSIYAQRFDSTGAGGVLPAVNDWCEKRGVRPLLLNNFVDGTGISDPNILTYKDGCGLGLIQKPI